MIVSARTLRAWSDLSSHAVDERVERCGACGESTPHARVIQRRAVLATVALTAGLGALLLDVSGGTVMAAALPAVSLAAFSIWLFLRRRDHRRPRRCLRCHDRGRRGSGIYLVDPML